MKKVIRIGTNKYKHNVYCNIELKKKDKELCLSITGVEQPYKSGNCAGSCGQINMGGIEIKEFAKGWNQEILDMFLGVWDKWHLNDMNAGTVVQDAALRAYKRKYPDEFQKDHYGACCKYLKLCGKYDDKGYKYGHGWLFRELPENVIEFLNGLPDSDKTPAWV